MRRRGADARAGDAESISSSDGVPRRSDRRTDDSESVSSSDELTCSGAVVRADPDTVASADGSADPPADPRPPVFLARRRFFCLARATALLPSPPAAARPRPLRWPTWLRGALLMA